MMEQLVNQILSQWQGPIAPEMQKAMERLVTSYVDIALALPAHPHKAAVMKDKLRVDIDWLIKFFRGVESINTTCLSERDSRVLMISLAYYYLSLFGISEAVRIDAAVRVLAGFGIPSKFPPDKKGDIPLGAIFKQLESLRGHLLGIGPRYIGGPITPVALLKELIELLMMSMDWMYFNRIKEDSRGVAAQVHDIYTKFRKMKNPGGPLPPAEEEMQTRIATHHLEGLMRYLSEGQKPLPDGDFKRMRYLRTITNPHRFSDDALNKAAHENPPRVRSIKLDGGQRIYSETDMRRVFEDWFEIPKS